MIKFILGFLLGYLAFTTTSAPVCTDPKVKSEGVKHFIDKAWHGEAKSCK